MQFKTTKIDPISIFILLAILSVYYLCFALANHSFNPFNYNIFFWLLVGYELGLQKKNIFTPGYKTDLKRYQANAMQKEHIDELFNNLKKDEEN